MAELNVAPTVILLCLNGRCDHRIDSNDRYDEQRTACAERFNSGAEKRTLLIDRVPQRQRRAQNRQPIELKLKNIQVAEMSAFEQPFIARTHDSDFRLHHA